MKSEASKESPKSTSVSTSTNHDKMACITNTRLKAIANYKRISL